MASDGHRMRSRIECARPAPFGTLRSSVQNETGLCSERYDDGDAPVSRRSAA